MSGEEKRLAAQYVDFIYQFLKLAFEENSESEPESALEKLEHIEKMLNSMRKRDEEAEKLLEAYKQMHNLRRKISNTIKEHLVVLRAVLEETPDQKVKKLLYDESEARLTYAQQLADKITNLVNLVQQPAYHKRANKLIELVKNNHKLIKEHIQIVTELIKTAKEELKKIRKTQQ